MNQYLVVIVVLEIVYLAVGLILCVIGKSLLEKGITGQFTAGGEVASRSFRIATSSPGLVFLLAGLAVVVSTVVEKSDYRTAIYGSASAPPTRTELQTTVDPVPDIPRPGQQDYGANVDRMLQSITIFNTFAESEKTALAGRLFDDARKKVDSNDTANALDSLAVAIVLNPAIFPTARSDAKTAALTEDPLLGELMLTRLKLLIKAQEEIPLTPAARAVGDRLKIFALSKPVVADKTKSAELIAAFPKSPGGEKEATTIQRLETLLRADPRVLVTMFDDPQYRWMMQEGEVFEWLKTHSETFFVEFN
jgi:hypothetical protein